MKLSTLSAAIAGVILGAAGVSYFQNHQARTDKVVASSSTESSTQPALTPGSEVKGELTSQSFLNLVNGVRSQAYTLTSTSDQIILLKVEGPLNAQLSVFKGSDIVATAKCDDCRQNTKDLSLGFKSTPNVDYTVVVSGANTHSYGPFELSNSILKSYAGEVIGGEIQFSDWGLGKARRYRLNIEKDGLYQIEMRSFNPQMDAYILVLDKRNRELASDDDGGNGTDALLQTYLKAGEYILETTSALGVDNFQGGYDVQVKPLELPVEISLNDNDAVTLDGLPHYGILEAPRSYYTLTLENPTIVEIEVEGMTDSHTPELRFKNQNASDYGGGGSKIRTKLAAGEHTLEVIRSKNSTSLFSLKAKALPADSEYAGGELDIGSTRNEKMFVGTGRNIYQFTIDKEGEYKILMESNDFDTYLSLYDINGLIAEDDDSASNLNSLIEMSLSPGDYELHAITLDSQQHRDMNYTIGVYKQ